jgi:hypothetical protein
MDEEYTDEQIQEWDKEDFGNLPDAFHLSQSEIDELRNAKKDLTKKGRQKLQELMNKEAERKALEAVEKLYAENGDGLKRLAEIERQEILDIARQGMVEYRDALQELAEND